MEKQTVFLIAGERSGDLHAVELLRSLHKNCPEVNFSGLGGSELHSEYGDSFEDWVEDAAVIGVTEVLKKYGWFKKKFDQTLAQILATRPSVVVFVDYPGFNLRMAKQLRKKGFQGLLIYYISPQVWAWNKSRIPVMARNLDLMLCVFEFEKALYEKSRLETLWVGHPMVEELEARKRSVQRQTHLVGLFPGSRSREVKALFPIMLAASEVLGKMNEALGFELSVPSLAIREIALGFLENSSLFVSGRLTVKVGESHILMQKATAAWIASGTATLEAGYYGLPYALVYKVSLLTYLIGKAVIKIPYLGMVNILLDKRVITEYVQTEVTEQALKEEMLRLLEDCSYRSRIVKELGQIPARLGGSGAHQKAANAIAYRLTSSL